MQQQRPEFHLKVMQCHGLLPFEANESSKFLQRMRRIAPRFHIALFVVGAASYVARPLFVEVLDPASQLIRLAIPRVESRYQKLEALCAGCGDDYVVTTVIAVFFWLSCVATLGYIRMATLPFGSEFHRVGRKQVWGTMAFTIALIVMCWTFFLADLDFSRVRTSDQNLRIFLDPMLSPISICIVYFLILMVALPIILLAKISLQNGKLQDE